MVEQADEIPRSALVESVDEALRIIIDDRLNRLVRGNPLLAENRFATAEDWEVFGEVCRLALIPLHTTMGLSKEKFTSIYSQALNNARARAVFQLGEKEYSPE